MDLNKILKLLIIIAILIITGAVFYHYVIFLPQRERAKLELQKQEQLAKEGESKEEAEKREQANRLLLDLCLEEADKLAVDSFVRICKLDERISGGDKESCESGTTEDAISYMITTKSDFPVFKEILNKREKDRAECFKKYPIK